MYRDEPDEVFVKAAERHVEALNQALRDVPADRVRMHVCWGNYEGPHHHDIGVEKIIDSVLQREAADDPVRGGQPAPRARVGGLAATRRSPTTRCSCPGVIDTTSNFIEHPELVAAADRGFADIVGPDRVIAGHRLRLRHVRRASARSTRRSAGRSSAPWPRARSSPRSACSSRRSLELAASGSFAVWTFAVRRRARQVQRARAATAATVAALMSTVSRGVLGVAAGEHDADRGARGRQPVQHELVAGAQARLGEREAAEPVALPRVGAGEVERDVGARAASAVERLLERAQVARRRRCRSAGRRRGRTGCARTGSCARRAARA